jgi:SOS-response transcriptional repressor LexA
MTSKLSAASILATSSHGTTEKQRRLLVVFRKLRDARGYPPTFREIAAAAGTNVGDVAAKFLRMRRDGVVSWVDGRARTVTIVEEVQHGPTDRD